LQEVLAAFASRYHGNRGYNVHTDLEIPVCIFKPENNHETEFSRMSQIQSGNKILG